MKTEKLSRPVEVAPAARDVAPARGSHDALAEGVGASPFMVQQRAALAGMFGAGAQDSDVAYAPVLQRQGAEPRETTEPSITAGTELALLGGSRGITASLVIATVKSALPLERKLQHVLGALLLAGVHGFVELPRWLTAIYGVVKGVSKIPAGVMSVILWGVGKIVLTLADEWRNRTGYALIVSQITEEKLFGILQPMAGAHQSLAVLIPWVEGLVSNPIKRLFNRNQSPVPLPDTLDRPADVAAKISDTRTFISLRVATPSLEKWDEGKDKARKTRAGLQAKASAHLTLLGESLGGDIDVKIPFGRGWKVETQKPFFESPPITKIPGFSIGSIRGDRLEFTDEGLTEVAMSINVLKVNGFPVTVDQISVAYQPKEQELIFGTKMSVPFWTGSKHHIQGDFELKIGRDGLFRGAGIKLQAQGELEVIADHLFVVNPTGTIDVFDDKPTSLDIKTDVHLKGIPGNGDLKAAAGVHYKKDKWSGTLQRLKVELRLMPNAVLAFEIVDGEFDSDGITAKRASAHFQYGGQPKEKTAEAPAATPEKLLETKLPWIDLSNYVNLEELVIHQELDNLRFAGGKFSYDKGKKNGLRKLKGKLLGVSGDYDADKGEGKVNGEVKHDLSIKLVQIDVPAVGPLGGFLHLEGAFGFDATLHGTLKKGEVPNASAHTALDLAGGVEAKATASVTLTIGAFLGVPYLINLKGGAYGAVTGILDGKVDLSGRMVYDSDLGRLKDDDSTPANGGFSLDGLVKASVGGHIKAHFLVFEKELYKAQFGSWDIGKFGLSGTIKSAEDGSWEFKLVKEGFEGKPAPVKVIKKVIPVDEWIYEAASSKQTIPHAQGTESALSKVARDIVYGGYSSEKVSVMTASYSGLLESADDKNKFTIEVSRFKGEHNKHQASFLWTKDEWGGAVNMSFFGSWQSRHKADISTAITDYHSLDKSKHKERLTKLQSMKVTVLSYQQKSKSENNQQQALKFGSQIDLEIARVELEAPPPGPTAH